MARNNVSVKISTTDGNRLVSSLMFFLLAVAFAVLAYFALIYVVIPVVGSMMLILLAVLSVYLLINSSKQKQYDQSVPFMTALGNEMRAQNPNANVTDESAYRMLSITLVGCTVAYILMVSVVLAYALNGTYQRVPLNYLGFATSIVMVANACNVVRQALMVYRYKTEPWRPASWRSRALGKIALVMGILYSFAIFAVKFGVL